MNDRNAPRLKKWPFYLADAALVGVALWVLNHYPHPLPAWAAWLMTASVLTAAVLAVWPFRVEYDTAVRVYEGNRLTNATDAIRNLEDVTRQIQQATGQWQNVQELSGKTTQSAREIADRMTAEARAFSEFMSKANDSEKATLRLEVEKLRRGESQWLQVLVHTLDHVHALYQAGSRSGQPNLAAQLGAFQNACRDLARRVGLVAIDAEVDQPFDASQHEIVQGHPQPDGPSQIGQVVAAGFSFQGQVLRRPVVVVKSETSSATSNTTALTGATSGDTSIETEESGVLAQDFAASASSGAASANLDETLGQVVTDLGDVVTEASGVTEISEVAAAESSSADVQEFRLESEDEDETDRRRAGNG